MRNTDRELWQHIAKCLGIDDRKLTKMTVRTTEFFGIINGDATYEDKRFELYDKDGYGNDPITQVQPHRL